MIRETAVQVVRCVDCIAEGVTRYRPPAPKSAHWRCVTHHRAFVKAQKARNHERYVQRTYGLPPGHYELLLAFQDGKCAILGKPSSVRMLAVDHDHETGEVRGLLTRKANHDLLGYFTREDLVRAISYLDDPPYRQMLRAKAST